MNPPTSLALSDSPDRPLTPAQRKFNQLLRKIEQAREALRLWQEQRALFAQAHATRVRPLLLELAGHQLAMVRKFDALLAGKGWTKSERHTLRELLCDVAADLIDAEHTDEAQAAELKALFDKHAEVDFDTENRQAVAAMKDLFETMTGVDLGDEEFESEEAMMRRAHERIHANREAAAASTAVPGSAGRKSKPPTAAQRRREREEQEASQSVREIFRKLASALHPDRAADDADRVRRTALMQRVNQAYEARDLLGLFALQLEIEQVDAEHLAHASAERARHYNHLLTEQLGNLQAEVQACEAELRMTFNLNPFQTLNPHKLNVFIERKVADLRSALATAQRDLRMMDDPVTAKKWLRRMRREAVRPEPFVG